MNLPYLLAELSHRPGRTLTAVLSVAVGVALFISLQAYAAGYRQAARPPLAQIGADIAAIQNLPPASARAKPSGSIDRPRYLIFGLTALARAAATACCCSSCLPS